MDPKRRKQIMDSEPSSSSDDDSHSTHEAESNALAFSQQAAPEGSFPSEERLAAIKNMNKIDKRAYNRLDKKANKERRKKYLAGRTEEKIQKQREHKTKIELARKKRVQAQETPEETERRKEYERRYYRERYRKKREAMGETVKTRPHRRLKTSFSEEMNDTNDETAATGLFTIVPPKIPLKRQSILKDNSNSKTHSGKEEVSDNENDINPSYFPNDLPLKVSLANPSEVTKFLKTHRAKLGGPDIKYLSPPGDFEDAELVVIDTLYPSEKEGLEYFGVVTSKRIAKGTRLFAGTGQLYARCNQLDENSNYIVDLYDFYLDSYTERSPSSFINHSVQNANVLARRVYVTRKKTHGQHRIKGFEIVAIKDIEPGEQILIDYGRQFTEHLKPGRKLIALNTKDNELTAHKIFQTNSTNYEGQPILLSQFSRLDDKFFSDFGLDKKAYYLVPITIRALAEGKNYIWGHISKDLPLLQNQQPDSINPLPNYGQKNITTLMLSAYFGEEHYLSTLLIDQNPNVLERQTGKSLLYYLVIGRASTEVKIRLIEKLFTFYFNIAGFYDAFNEALKVVDVVLIKALIKSAKPNLTNYIFKLSDGNYQHGDYVERFHFDALTIKPIFDQLTNKQIIDIIEAIDEVSTNHNVVDQLFRCLEDHPAYKIYQASVVYPNTSANNTVKYTNVEDNGMVVTEDNEVEIVEDNVEDNEGEIAEDNAEDNAVEIAEDNAEDNEGEIAEDNVEDNEGEIAEDNAKDNPKKNLDNMNARVETTTVSATNHGALPNVFAVKSPFFDTTSERYTVMRFNNALKMADTQLMRQILETNRNLLKKVAPREIREIFARNLKDHEIEKIVIDIDKFSKNHDIVNELFGLLDKKSDAYKIYQDIIFLGSSSVDKDLYDYDDESSDDNSNKSRHSKS